MRQKSNLAEAGNQTLMSHFRPDIPKRLKGGWCKTIAVVRCFIFTQVKDESV